VHFSIWRCLRLLLLWALLRDLNVEKGLGKLK